MSTCADRVAQLYMNQNGPLLLSLNSSRLIITAVHRLDNDLFLFISLYTNKIPLSSAPFNHEICCKIQPLTFINKTHISQSI